MPCSYHEALTIQDSVANLLITTASTNTKSKYVPLFEAVGQKCAQSITSPVAIPPFDSAATDGFAINSAATARASPSSPVLFKVVATIAPGDSPSTFDLRPTTMYHPCVEIMNGASFPINHTDYPLDACCTLEKARVADSSDSGDRIIQVTAAVRTRQYRRQASSDISKGDILISEGAVVETKHVLSLASAGIYSIKVRSKLAIGVAAIGTELTTFDAHGCDGGKIRDANGPYLTKVLEDWGANTTLYGPIRDASFTLRQFFAQCCQRSNLDVIVTTGGVSNGRFDFVRTCLEQAENITVHYTDVAVRPGQSIVFATYTPLIDTDDTTTPPRRPPSQNLHQHHHPPKPKAIFALPGNPISAAACLTFFVLPFLSRLTSLPAPTPREAFVRDISSHQELRKAAYALGQGSMVLFQHGTLRKMKTGWEFVRHPDQASYKVSAFAESNCWVKLGGGEEGALWEGTTRVRCWPFGKVEEWGGDVEGDSGLKGLRSGGGSGSGSGSGGGLEKSGSGGSVSSLGAVRTDSG